MDSNGIDHEFRTFANLCLPVLFCIAIENQGNLGRAQALIADFIGSVGNNCDVIQGTDIAVVTVNDGVALLQDWRKIPDMDDLRFETGDMMGLNGAIVYSVDKIRERQNELEAKGVNVIRPHLAVITDAVDESVGVVEVAADFVKRRMKDNRLNFSFISCGDADSPTTRHLAASFPNFCSIDSVHADLMDAFGYERMAYKSSPREPFDFPLLPIRNISDGEFKALDPWDFIN